MDDLDPLVAEQVHERHVLVRHRDESDMDPRLVGVAPVEPGQLLVLATPGAHQVPTLVSTLPALLADFMDGITSVWVGVGGLAASAPLLADLSSALGASVVAPDGGVAAMPGAALYAGYGAGGTGWYAGDEFLGARFPCPEWESWLPGAPVLVDGMTAVPAPCGLVIADDLGHEVPVNQRFPKIVVGAPVRPAAAVAALLGDLPDRPVMIVPATPEAATQTWLAELATLLGRDVVFSAGTQVRTRSGALSTIVPDAAGNRLFRPFPLVLRVGGDDQQVLDTAAAPPGWERAGRLSYRLTGADVVADVVPSGLVIRTDAETPDPAAEAAPFDPAGWTLTLGTPGRAVGLPVLTAAEDLLTVLPAEQRAVVRVRMSGVPDPEAEHALDHSSSTRRQKAAPPTASPAIPPTALPTVLPAVAPGAPSFVRSAVASAVPPSVASAVPPAVPSGVPPAVASAVPPVVASGVPLALPPSEPSAVPSAVRSVVQSGVASAAPLGVPPAVLSGVPSVVPASVASAVPSALPPGVPSAVPPAVPSAGSSAVPPPVPSSAPSVVSPAVPSGVISGAPVVTTSGAPVSTVSGAPSLRQQESVERPASVPAAPPEERTERLPAVEPADTPAGAAPGEGAAVPAGRPLDVSARASTAAEQSRFTTAAGESFAEALAVVNASMATWPSMRGDESLGAKADYVAVCLFLGRGDGGSGALNGALRFGHAGVLDGQVPCLMSGIRRLPTHRRAVLRQGKVHESLEHVSPPGTVLTEPGFLAGSIELDVTLPGADLDVLIWPSTARRTSELMLARPIDEAVFLAGARFKALAVRTAEDEDEDDEGPAAPRIAVLYRELAPGETPTTTELDERDLAVLAKLDGVLARRHEGPLRLVEDPEVAARLTTSMVVWQQEAAAAVAS